MEKEIKTEEDFINNVLKSKDDVVVLFYAPFIGESIYVKKMLKKYIKESKYKDKCFFLDVNKVKNLVEDYLIYTIPSLIFFKDGEISLRVEGFITESIISSILKNI